MSKIPPGFAELSEAALSLRGRTQQALDHACQMAVSLLDAQSAALMLNQEGVSRTIASAGLEKRFRAYKFVFSETPYEPDARIIITDAEKQKKYPNIGVPLGLPPQRFFMRCPIIVEKDYTLALLIFSAEPGAKPQAKRQAVLSELEDVIREEFLQMADLLTTLDKHVTLPATLAEIEAEVVTAAPPTAILDGKLNFHAMNDAMAKLLRAPAKDLIGKNYAELGNPTAEATNFFCRHALDTRVSPPEFEVVITDGESIGVWSVSAAPFSPTDTTDYFLYITVREISGLRKRTETVADKIADRHKRAPVEPSFGFLTETLVERNTIRSRNGVSYLTLRSWRKPIRNYQITALKALKQKLPPEMPLAVADEIADEIGRFIGHKAFRAIVPMPCGHSAADSCLSVEIARCLGAKLGLPVVKALGQKPAKGVSHPKENTKRPPLELLSPFDQPVLLIDDVATSGQHIEEAVTMLKPGCGSVFAIAWISGDAA